MSASTQNRALSALRLLYREVIEVDPPRLNGAVRARRPKRVPAVLTKDEGGALLAQLDLAVRLPGEQPLGRSGRRRHSATSSRREDRTARYCISTIAPRRAMPLMVWPEGVRTCATWPSAALVTALPSALTLNPAPCARRVTDCPC